MHAQPKHGFFEWLLHLLTHAAWDFIKELAKFLAPFLGCFAAAREWLNKNYGLVFILGLATVAAFLLLNLAILYERRRAAAETPEREDAPIEKAPASSASTKADEGAPSRKEQRETIIHPATLDEIKEYDPRIRKISLIVGRAAAFVIVAASALSFLITGHGWEDIRLVSRDRDSFRLLAFHPDRSFPWLSVLLGVVLVLLLIQIDSYLHTQRTATDAETRKAKRKAAS